MEIKYLKNLLSNKHLFENSKGQKLEGLEKSEIQEVQQMYILPLPGALKELYYLGGKNLFSMTSAFSYNGYLFMKVIFSEPENLDIYKYFILDFKCRIILSIEDYDYTFVNLYEGDNPPVYMNTFIDYDTFEIKKIFESISEMIDFFIEERKSL